MMKTFFESIRKKANQKYLNAKLNKGEFKERVKDALVKLKDILKQESIETKEMLEVYQRYTRGEATKKEMEEANKQFRDVIKGVGLGVIIVLPFSPITIPIIAKLGKRLGVDVFPTAVKEQMSKEKN